MAFLHFYRWFMWLPKGDFEISRKYRWRNYQCYWKFLIIVRINYSCLLDKLRLYGVCLLYGYIGNWIWILINSKEVTITHRPIYNMYMHAEKITGIFSIICTKLDFWLNVWNKKKMKTKPKLIKSALLVSHSKALLG